MQNGRREIFTDENLIDYSNVINVLQDAMSIHAQNAADCDFLLNYEAGYQPLKREKKYRSDINCYCNDNIANEITEFKLGFNWGNPITFVQRGQIDSGTEEESKAIAMLNECYDAANIKTKTQKLARFLEITGIGYTYVDINTDYEDGDSYFTIEALDPRNAFVIKSSALGHKPMLGVTYTTDKNGNRYFTCFTNDARYEITNMTKITNGKVEPGETDLWNHNSRSGEINPIGAIPIVEWIRSHDRMGCFERQIPEMDNLNLLISDYTNDVDQNTQAIFHANDIEFPTDGNGNVIHPQTNDWVCTQTTADGKQPFITPLAVNYDYNGMLNNIITRRSVILQKCDVPQRDTTSGGSSGVAMDSATGWNAAETSACKEQEIVESCKMQEVKIVLKAIKSSAFIEAENPMLKLRYIDMKPNIKRQKTYELSTKANCFATLVSHGISGIHALNAINLFDDINQVWTDSKEMIEMYQDSIFNKQNDSVGGDGEQNADSGKTMQDLSDQNASPNYTN